MSDSDPGEVLSPVRPCPLPGQSLLQRYQRAGDFTDCYSTTLSGQVSQAQFIQAFYTTWLFKLERFILRWLVSRPSTDAEAFDLAENRTESFAAWTVEARDERQLLMCDYQGRTRSWLMSQAEGAHGLPSTQLYFGSAVVARSDQASGEKRMGTSFGLLLGFHKLYSRALLHAARRRLRRVAKT